MSNALMLVGVHMHDAKNKINGMGHHKNDCTPEADGSVGWAGMGSSCKAATTLTCFKIFPLFFLQQNIKQESVVVGEKLSVYCITTVACIHFTVIFICILTAEKHPKIKELFGHDVRLKWWVAVLVTFQLASLFLVRKMSWPLALFLSYCVGGTINHSLMLGQ